MSSQLQQITEQYVSAAQALPATDAEIRAAVDEALTPVVVPPGPTLTFTHIDDEGRCYFAEHPGFAFPTNLAILPAPEGLGLTLTEKQRETIISNCGVYEDGSYAPCFGFTYTDDDASYDQINLHHMAQKPRFPNDPHPPWRWNGSFGFDPSLTTIGIRARSVAAAAALLHRSPPPRST